MQRVCGILTGVSIIAQHCDCTSALPAAPMTQYRRNKHDGLVDMLSYASGALQVLVGLRHELGRQVRPVDRQLRLRQLRGPERRAGVRRHRALLARLQSRQRALFKTGARTWIHVVNHNVFSGTPPVTAHGSNAAEVRACAFLQFQWQAHVRAKKVSAEGSRQAVALSDTMQCLQGGDGDSAVPVPWFDQQRAFDFVCKHGLAVRAVGAPLTQTVKLAHPHACLQQPRVPLMRRNAGDPAMCSLHAWHMLWFTRHLLWSPAFTCHKRHGRVCGAVTMLCMPSASCALHCPGISVADAGTAFEAAVAHGATAVQPPTTLADEASGTEQTVAEVALYGDVVMRFVSGSFRVRYGDVPSLPHEAARIRVGSRVRSRVRTRVRGRARLWLGLGLGQGLGPGLALGSGLGSEISGLRFSDGADGDGGRAARRCFHALCQRQLPDAFALSQLHEEATLC